MTSSKFITSISSPTTIIAAQFNVFRDFALSALEDLHRQVQLLAKQQDHFEMRSRRKMLLVHGILENKKEDTVSIVNETFNYHLKINNVSSDSLSRCHRISIEVCINYDVRKYEDVFLNQNAADDNSAQLENFGSTVTYIVLALVLVVVIFFGCKLYRECLRRVIQEELDMQTVARIRSSLRAAASRRPPRKQYGVPV
ncbi:unnamed protein product [Euphydryas editha]|uniref:Uncharacterized protein n=1 Tax=Euphydryas editha TaxID=104508 RepID=A0AAU9UN02_EUPED|nr:unnamed protein product [Euphydryas editha]